RGDVSKFVADETVADETVADVLLDGYIFEKDRGRQYMRYLEQQNEAEARRRFARFLRSGGPGGRLISRKMCDMLAAVIDTDNGLRIIEEIPGECFAVDQYTPNRRELLFRFRNQAGKSTDHVRNTQIIQYIVNYQRNDQRPIAELSDGAREAAALHFVLSE